MSRGSEHDSGPTLVRRAQLTRESRQWEQSAEAVLAAESGFLRVIGGPGTGKTTLLAEAAARRILAGGKEDVLVLTASRQAADALRSEIAGLLTAGAGGSAGTPRTVREPLVRTVHSYAFGVLRAQAAADGTPPPRLLSGPEQDAVVRELLAGDAEIGAPDWPERLRPALTVPGFAEELRDLLMRAAERGLGPDDLIRLGRRTRHDEWVAAGTFWRQYEQVTLLQGAGGSALAMPAAAAYDAAELVTSALLSLVGDAGLLAAERARVRSLFVDDCQHLDPLQWRLLRLIGDGARLFVLAGDPDQAVFSFRGADPRILADADPHGANTVHLRQGHRMRPAVRAAAAQVAESAARPYPVPAAAPGEDSQVVVRRFPTAAAEASWIADRFRRAHLVDGIPWREMAIVVRSAARTFPVLQRALRAGGVPVASAAEGVPLARNPAVRPLLAALRVVADPAALDARLAEELLGSPLGGADPLALRRVRRGLRRLDQAGGGDSSSDELIVTALNDNDPLPGLADAEAAPLRRLGAVIAAGRAALARSEGVEQVLWAMWQAGGLQRRWQKASARGGSLGRKADADLDAVVALFHAAEAYVDRLPHEGVAGFAGYLLSQRIAGDSLAPSAAKSDGIELVTAHGACGREWTVVAVAAVQEGSWPDLRLRGSLLGVERMVDLLSGIDPEQVSAVAPVLAEERRLFSVAVSRARARLLVSACEGDEEQPSRFLDELAEAGDPGPDRAVVPARDRPLVLSSLVGELRAVVCDAQAEPARRRAAARQLARLAAARVPGAHPELWYGLAPVSTDEPVRPPDEVVAVSPSTVELLDRCPLRWLIERHGGSEPAQLAAVTGTLVHGLAQQAAEGATAEELTAALDDAWRHIDVGAPWYARSERDRVDGMVEAFLGWLRLSRAELTAVAVEAGIEAELPCGPGEQRVRLVGRVDRLERDRAGRTVIVDIKTQKTPVSGQDAQQHAQLAAYQLAVSLDGAEPGGGQLLFLAKTDKRTGLPVVRAQDPLDEQTRAEWQDRVRAAAQSGLGPVFVGREGTDCDRCAARRCCPTRPEGRQVTS